MLRVLSDVLSLLTAADEANSTLNLNFCFSFLCFRWDSQWSLCRKCSSGPGHWVPPWAPRLECWPAGGCSSAGPVTRHTAAGFHELELQFWQDQGESLSRKHLPRPGSSPMASGSLSSGSPLGRGYPWLHWIWAGPESCQPNLQELAGMLSWPSQNFQPKNFQSR